MSDLTATEVVEKLQDDIEEADKLQHFLLRNPCCSNPALIFGSSEIAGIYQIRCLRCNIVRQGSSWAYIIANWNVAEELPCMELISM